MTPERWREVEEVYHAARERAPRERTAYLERVCGADVALRREVESLLQADEGSSGFLEPPSLTRAPAGIRLDLRFGAALEGRYRMEGELGRGGMATVYLAHDLKHDRPVALKVLHPEIAAGWGAERFLREIRLTARLQHPHILPVFDSGASDDLLWYTMPYVRGESLRERLRRERQLPLDTALEIARQAAHALEHAHQSGVVHRDIKPENILLREGQALVADFGVARATSAASEEPLTEAGLAIGTPAYMAPEQAVGGEVDARTDIYALGSVLFEMLTGEAPFTGPTPQAIIAKRLTTPAPSVGALRPGVPTTVDQAIRQAMDPVAADRFGSATEFVQALQVSGQRAKDTPRRVRPGRLRWVSGLVAAAAAIAIAAGYSALERFDRGAGTSLLSTGVLHRREPILIADFGSRGPDSLLGLAVSEAFRTDFAQSTVVTVVPPTRADDALALMQRSAAARLDPALAREVALRLGVKAVVTGDVTALGRGYLLSVQLLSPESGEILAAQRESAESSDALVPAIDRLSKHLRASIGEPLKALRSGPSLAQVTTGSLAALRKYSLAIRTGNEHRDFVHAIPLLEDAVALDTGFASAWRSLGGMRSALGDQAGAVEAFTKAVQHRDRLTELERDHTVALYTAEILYQRDNAAALYRAILERHPTDSLALNNLALLYLQLGQPERADTLLRRLVALEPVPGPGEPTASARGAHSRLNLATAQVSLGKRSEAEAIFRRTAQTFGRRRDIDWYGVVLASALGDYDTAERRATTFLARYLDPRDHRLAVEQLGQLASVRGQLSRSARYLVDAMADGEGEPRAYLENAMVLGFLDVWRHQAAHGLRTVETALQRVPLNSIAPANRPYLSLALLYTLAGKPQQARALLGDYEREVRPLFRHADESLLHWAWGQVAMAEGRLTDAIGEFRAFEASPRNCIPCGLTALAQAYDRAGQPDSAIAVYLRYIQTPNIGRLGSPFRLGNDGAQLALAHKRLGELYQQRGDIARARDQYTRFVALWQGCDAELRPAVLQVTERLRQLDQKALRAMPDARGVQPAAARTPGGSSPRPALSSLKT